jgi:hypothetical protein
MPTGRGRLVAGMVVLRAASVVSLGIPDRTAVTLVEMAVWMTLPMVAWMRVRRHERGFIIVPASAGAAARTNASIS